MIDSLAGTVSLLITLLGLLMIAASTPTLGAWITHPISAVLFLGYIYGMRLVATSGQLPMWQPKMTRETHDEQTRTPAFTGALSWLWLRFLSAGSILALCGAALAKSGIAISELTGLSETFVGALLTGVISSMPELVTAITAVRIGALTLAVSNIVGGNAFDAVIVSVADFAYPAGPIYADAGPKLVTLLATTLVMNTIVLLGLLRRERHGLGNIGLEGVMLLGLYGGLVYWLVG